MDIREIVSDVFETPFHWVAAGLALSLFIVLAQLRFCSSVTTPPLPPMPELSSDTGQELRAKIAGKSDAYSNFIEEDAKSFGVPAPTLEELESSFKYERRTFKKRFLPGQKEKGAGLVVELTADKSGQDRALKLKIHNSTDDHLAYRVVTKPSHRRSACYGKYEIDHNALTIEPNETITRTECVYQTGWHVTLESIETVTLPELGGRYVSKLIPTAIGVEKRVSSGHKPKIKQCPFNGLAQLETLMKAGGTTWRDIVDFYGRHNCERYNFIPKYKAVVAGETIKLPIME